MILPINPIYMNAFIITLPLLLDILDKHCKVNLGKSWKKLESDLIIRNKLNFKSDLIFRNGGSIIPGNWNWSYYNYAEKLNESWNIFDNGMMHCWASMGCHLSCPNQWSWRRPHSPSREECTYIPCTNILPPFLRQFSLIWLD